ncbi:hypothetical protein C1H46_044273 [Malus baccata]|uniref:Uncharacterized protein n=1 Tax=Malus baccata TaxID=106549 RepID=A0A540K7J7_MALBA|nr:hypothetical protein C1H46_044273 [Malus baccata]
MDSREQHAGLAVWRPSSSSNRVSKWNHIKIRRKTKNKRLQGFISSMPWHAIFAFLNPLLIGVLQVKCQGATESPFDTHPRHMWIFLSTTLVYCFALAANIKSRRNCTAIFYSRMSGHIALLTGSLSSVSLVSIFFPSVLDEQLVFFSWIVMPLIVGRTLIGQVCKYICKSTANAVLLVHSIWQGFARRTEQPQLPV